MAEDFTGFLAECQQRINCFLDQKLPPAISPADNLKHAMRYSCLDGGKRVRAALVYATARLFVSQPDETIDTAAAAIECIHAYSLIHDDLPAMDNDDLRRGKPTCHKAYDEATAILAGDALQTQAFELLSGLKQIDSSRALEMISLLARASGVHGMVAGQTMDMDATGHHVSLEILESIHRHKTGALINASVIMGALAAGVSLEKNEIYQQLEQYGTCIGLAFQVCDDILDVQSSTEVLGKTSGADANLAKATYVSLLGLEGAHEKMHQLRQNALDALDGFGQRADTLRLLANYIVERVH